jgi:hypothetical protein
VTEQRSVCDMRAPAGGVPVSGPLSAWMSAYEQPWALGLPTQADPHPQIAQLVGEEILRSPVASSWSDSVMAPT